MGKVAAISPETYTRWRKSELGAIVTGLDVSPAMLDAARHRADAAGLSIEWREGRAEALPFPEGSFDAAIAVTVLCWVSDAAAAVREIARVLGPAVLS